MNLAEKSVFSLSREKRRSSMERKMKGRIFDPERYEMMFCSACDGTGKSFHDVTGPVVCTVCGGFGLVKIEGKGNWSVRLGKGLRVELNLVGHGQRMG